MPVARDVADQIGAIDALRELTLDVIAALDLNAAYIRSGWRINFGPDEETALDQLWHRRAFHQHLEDVAEAAPIPTTRGCRDRDHSGPWDRNRAGCDRYARGCAAPHRR